MNCPFCNAGSQSIRVIDSREVSDGIRRRRECQECRQRFTTYERIAAMSLLVVKRDGRRESFNRDKLMAGMRVACAKRPISVNELDKAVHEIEHELYQMGQPEVSSQVIGELVMERLRRLDDVAYVRFASVYRRFHDVDSLAAEIEALRERKRREEELKRQLRLAL
jgi:transcriptional repressor NrdR